MELIYTDAGFVDIGLLDSPTVDMATGVDENDFLLTVGTERIPRGGLVYAPGTEWGGMVDEPQSEATKKSSGATISTVRYKGLTWSGLLASQILCPDSGKDYVEVSGEANACIATLIARQGIGGLFSASSASSGVTVSWRFDRFCTLWDGLRKVLAASGLRLSIARGDTSTVLSAVPRLDWDNQDEWSSDQYAISIKHPRPVNHLVCLGSGELKARVVVHLYADESGVVSQTKSIYPPYERSEVYDYTNADSSELIEKGTEKLTDYQDADEVSIQIDATETERYVGDVVGGIDPVTGLYVQSPVTKKILRIDDGRETVSYETKDVSTRGSLREFSEKSGESAYSAGDGITISNMTVSVDEMTSGEVDDICTFE